MSLSDKNIESLETVLKSLIGLGIILVTVALIFFFIKMTPTFSWELHLAIAGAVLIAMTFLSIKIFRSF